MSLLDRIKKLEQEMGRRRLIDSEDIIVSRSAKGVQLFLDDPSAEGEYSGDYYYGFFRLVVDEEAENTIKIVDGSGLLAEGYCGIYVSGIDRELVAEDSLEISRAAAVMFYASYAESEWSFEFKAEAAIPEFTEDKFAALLGWVKWDTEEDVMGQPVQIWNNGIIYNNRYS